MLSDVVADQVRHYRDAREMRRVDLAIRCSELGWPALTEGALFNLETGRRNAAGIRRREVTADEIMVLAAALDVPPVTLMLPIGESAAVEILPGRTVPVAEAADWISGEDPAASDAYRDAMAPLRRQRQLESAMAALAGRVSADLSVGDAHEIEPLYRDVHLARELLRAAGDPLPEAPDWFQVLDQQFRRVATMIEPAMAVLREISEARETLRQRGVPEEVFSPAGLIARFGGTEPILTCLEVLLAETAPEGGDS